MGTIETVFLQIKPLDRMYEHKTIRYDAVSRGFDIDCTGPGCPDCHLLVRVSGDGALRAFFYCYIPRKPVQGDPASWHKSEVFYFPAINVLSLLAADTSAIPGWRKESLRGVAEYIRDHGAGLNRAFSQENRDRTIAALLTMDNGDQEDLEKARRGSWGIME